MNYSNGVEDPSRDQGERRKPQINMVLNSEEIVMHRIQLCRFRELNIQGVWSRIEVVGKMVMES